MDYGRRNYIISRSALSKGDILFFHPCLIHAGDAYRNSNLRLHYYVFIKSAEWDINQAYLLDNKDEEMLRSSEANLIMNLNRMISNQRRFKERAERAVEKRELSARRKANLDYVDGTHRITPHYCPRHFPHGGRLIVHLNKQVTKGLILAHLRDSPQPNPPNPASSLHDHIQPLLRHHTRWTIYTDAAWRQLTTTTPDAAFQCSGSHTGAGCLLLVPTADTLLDHNILPIYFTTNPISPAAGGSRSTLAYASRPD